MLRMWDGKMIEVRPILSWPRPAVESLAQYQAKLRPHSLPNRKQLPVQGSDLLPPTMDWTKRARFHDAGCPIVRFVHAIWAMDRILLDPYQTAFGLDVPRTRMETHQRGRLRLLSLHLNLLLALNRLVKHAPMLPTTTSTSSCPHLEVGTMRLPRAHLNRSLNNNLQYVTIFLAIFHGLVLTFTLPFGYLGFLLQSCDPFPTCTSHRS